MSWRFRSLIFGLIPIHMYVCISYVYGCSVFCIFYLKKLLLCFIFLIFFPFLRYLIISVVFDSFIKSKQIAYLILKICEETKPFFWTRPTPRGLLTCHTCGQLLHTYLPALIRHNLQNK